MASNRTLAEIEWALKDIADTLRLYRDEPLDHPYHAQLWAEWDEKIAELQAYRKAHAGTQRKKAA
jgi:hypothetical protein